MMRDACEMWLGPEYGADGLRFDSANDFPKETVQARLHPGLTGTFASLSTQLIEEGIGETSQGCVQAMTWAIREKFPGRILTAEVCRLLHFPWISSHSWNRGRLLATVFAVKLSGTSSAAQCACHTAPAQVTPENPMSVHELGFDSVWVHSGYFDIIQQTRALGRGHHGGQMTALHILLVFHHQ